MEGVPKSLWETSRYPSDLVEDQWWISERPKRTNLESTRLILSYLLAFDI